MSKKLSEMTLAELWQLFPIYLTAHNPIWDTYYEEESAALCAVLPKTAKLYHIGSTAVPSIWAKPIVDIMVILPDNTAFSAVEDAVLRAGYRKMCEDENRVSYNKGYTEDGFAERVFHLHLRHTGDDAELYFRDYLLENPSVAAEYEKLKLSLWKRYEHNRDGYTEAKGDFIRRATLLAKEAYGNKYS